MTSCPNPLNVAVMGARADGEQRPSRAAECGHCGRTLAWLPGGQWTDPFGSWECPRREGADRHGLHQPSTPILHPPA